MKNFAISVAAGVTAGMIVYGFQRMTGSGQVMRPLVAAIKDKNAKRKNK